MISTDKSIKHYGFFRAEVVNNKDKDDFGKILVWIPDLMPKVDRTKGLWALPANNPLGGINNDGDSSNFYMGTTFIPAKGSWVWIFFENGNMNRPYYFSALNIEHAKILPENRIGTEKEKKWVIFKSNKGRTVVISDDPSDERVEITGKKRKLTGKSSGDVDSVYPIDGNQTTILLDERSGKEKLLIKTYKGDFIKINITTGDLQGSFSGNITLETKKNMYLKADGVINIKSGANTNIQGLNTNIKASGKANTQASRINLNATSIKVNGLITDGAGTATSASENAVSGERD